MAGTVPAFRTCKKHMETIQIEICRVAPREHPEVWSRCSSFSHGCVCCIPYPMAKVCVNLPLNRCVTPPPGMGVPFSMNTSTLETENFVYRPPQQNLNAATQQVVNGSNRRQETDGFSHPDKDEPNGSPPRETWSSIGWLWVASKFSTSTVAAVTWLKGAQSGKKLRWSKVKPVKNVLQVCIAKGPAFEKVSKCDIRQLSIYQIDRWNPMKIFMVWLGWLMLSAIIIMDFLSCQAKACLWLLCSCPACAASPRIPQPGTQPIAGAFCFGDGDGDVMWCRTTKMLKFGQRFLAKVW